MSTTPTTTDTSRSRNPFRVVATGIAALLVTGTVAMATPATASAAPTQRVTASQAADPLDRLRADGMLVETPVRASSANIATAATFGRYVFKAAARHGGKLALSEALSWMGYDPNSGFTAAMKDINSSIAALNDEVRRISELVERVLEGQDRTNFYNSYTEAGIAAANLDTAMRSVTMWIEKDLQPSESNLSDMQTVITTSIGQLDFLLTNPTTGAVPLMMKAAEPAKVSDLNSYWTQIETLRDDYRAVLAQALATLSAMERWDTTGTIAADLETFTPRATQTVQKMYEFGIRLKTTRVHVKGSTDMLVHPNAHLVSGESNPRLVGNRGDVEHHLQALANNYRAADHGGKSLESYLLSAGVPTTVNYLDTYRFHQLNSWWESLNTQGKIVGNGYQTANRTFGEKWGAMYPKGHLLAQEQAYAQRDMDGPGAKLVSVSLNAGGRAADFTPAAIQQAAFG